MWCGLHGLDADLPWIVVGQTGAAARDHTPHQHCFGSSHHLTQTIRYASWEVTIWAQFLENTMLVLYRVGLIYIHVIVALHFALPAHNFRNMLGCYHGVETIQ